MLLNSCLIDGGDCTACYYVDGRREIIHKSIKTVLREIARHEGVLANGIQSTGQGGFAPKQNKAESCRIVLFASAIFCFTVKHGKIRAQHNIETKQYRRE